MKQIKDKKLNFMDFYKELCTLLDEDGTLKDVNIINCTVSNIPKNYIVIDYVNNIFCGFKMTGACTVDGNIFKPKKGGKIKYNLPKNLIVYEVENLHPKKDKYRIDK